ncbi:MAG: alanine racemase [Nitrospirae bacterium]|nr:alanine racemase [Nitrospirota bacterium]
MSPLRAATAEVDLNALRHNLEWIRGQIPAGCRILAVVKANAYGHGAIPVSLELAGAGVEMLGVALVEEGMALREAGIGVPILVMGGIFEEQVPEILRYGLIPVLYRLPLAESLHRAVLASGGAPVPVHLKIDTGMGRLGLRPEEVEGFVEAVFRLEGVRLEGIMTHFSEADLADKSFADEQIALFRRVCDTLESRGLRLLRHLANSAAVTDLPESHFDMVRPGLMLYGYHPSRTDLPLLPILTLKTRIAHLKQVPEGTPISYGRTFVTKRESRIATLPVGYADGFARNLSNRGEVLVRGRRAPVVGRVCMDMTMVDVTQAPDAVPGDEVVLIGRQGKEEISAHDVAARAETVCYEILSRIGPRVERIHVPVLSPSTSLRAGGVEGKER